MSPPQLPRLTYMREATNRLIMLIETMIDLYIESESAACSHFDGVQPQAPFRRLAQSQRFSSVEDCPWRDYEMSSQPRCVRYAQHNEVGTPFAVARSFLSGLWHRIYQLSSHSRVKVSMFIHLLNIPTCPTISHSVSRRERQYSPSGASSQVQMCQSPSARIVTCPEGDPSNHC